LFTTSCFQDLGQDIPFDYPEQPAAPAYNPLKLFLPFDGNVEDGSTYSDFWVLSPVGNLSFPDGRSGKAYKGGAGMYFLAGSANAPGTMMLADTLSGFKAFTVAYWMYLPVADVGGAQCIFSIPNKTGQWGNMDIYTDWGRVRLHVSNKRTGILTEGWVTDEPSVIVDRWVHYAIRYSGETSTFTIFIDGEVKWTQIIPDYGEIVFETPNTFIIGNFGQNAVPPLSLELGVWAEAFKGTLDQFRLYNAALSDAEIKSLFDSQQ
jgi:hypothetical protein